MRNSRRDLFPRQNSKAIQRESGSRIEPTGWPVKCDWRAFYPLSTLGSNTTFKVHYPPRSIIEIGSPRVF
jgi:hypothetical protein